ncbi:hypothetical protein AQV86_00105 [Nanohaloarchaea archaeon SG9]|nr:hypothetical protein AQV86_00105 [Nanohaloarchaea archaeon SG9]
MNDQDTLRIGPRPERYLNLRPHDTYDENIEALESVIDGEYDKIWEVYDDMHPRVFHKAFSDFYGQEGGPAKVDSKALEDMRTVLEHNSAKDHFWIEENLFNLGYRLGPKEKRRTGSEKRRERQNPDIAHSRDMMPEIDVPMPKNPVREGRKKREGDEYYRRVNESIGLEIFNFDIEVL